MAGSLKVINRSFRRRPEIKQMVNGKVLLDEHSNKPKLERQI